MAAAMRTSVGRAQQIRAVISRGNSRSCLHTTSHQFLRKRRVYSRGVEKVAKNSKESCKEESPNLLRHVRATMNGSSSSLTPELRGQDSSQTRVPPNGAIATNKGQRQSHGKSWIEKSDGNDMMECVPRYTKAGPDDKRLGRAAMLTKSRKYREQSGKIILEGRRLIADAFESGAKAETIFFSQVSNIEGLPLGGSKVNLVKVTYKDISLWSDVSTPQGIVGVFQRPKYENIISQSENLPISLICDNIRDPGNLGTIIRSAAALPCQKILLTKGCVDVWEPKVLRSGAGAHFRVPIISNIPWTSIPNYLPSNRSVHIADCNYVHNHDLVTLSNYEVSSHPSEYPQNAKYDGDDSNVLDEWLKFSGEMDTTNDARTVPYYRVNWTLGDCALVIGGETEGLSKEARELCTETDGRRIFIPMSMGIDSLNAAMATSVILFEAKRQFLMTNKSH